MSVTAASLCGTGDVIAQQIEFKMHITSPGKQSYNFERTARMAAWGLLFAGPLYSGWYKFLDRATHMLPRNRMVATKLVSDTFMFNPLLLAAYFGVTGVMEQKTAAQVKEKVYDRWGPAIVTATKSRHRCARVCRAASEPGHIGLADVCMGARAHVWCCTFAPCAYVWSTMNSFRSCTSFFFLKGKRKKQ